ncbi:AraC family transcriptional regulator [Paracoccus sp. p4-l81]|uniref:helix-turn-helix transcriptional regulator n=1 Tax=unclassified Paracoccus (in: a-proteobacteria) TaxID=2688777 RepID=UPI0035B9B522
MTAAFRPDPDLDPRDPMARLASLTRLARGPKWRHESVRSLDRAVLYWFTRGQGRFNLAGTVQGYGAHHALILPAGTLHGFDLSAQTQGWMLTFPAGFAGLPDAPAHLRLPDLARQAELTQWIDRLGRELAEPDSPGAARAADCLCGLIAVWLMRQTSAAPAAPRPASAAERMAARFAAAMEQAFRTGQDVTDIATALGVSPAYLGRACRESCGRSAHDLLHERRLFEARRLLVDTDRAVGEVARAAGFQSAAYFTRAFVAATGQTPSAFRQAEESSHVL